MKLVDLLLPLKTLFQPPTEGMGAAVAPVHGQTLDLAHAPLGQACRIAAVLPPDAAPQWARWLAEIGFIPGEPATVYARSPWGDGAVVVRIGSSTFALRREEAACIAVLPI